MYVRVKLVPTLIHMTIRQSKYGTVLIALEGLRTVAAYRRTLSDTFPTPTSIMQRKSQKFSLRWDSNPRP